MISSLPRTEQSRRSQDFEFGDLDLTLVSVKLDVFPSVALSRSYCIAIIVIFDNIS